MTRELHEALHREWLTGGYSSKAEMARVIDMPSTTLRDLIGKEVGDMRYREEPGDGELLAWLEAKPAEPTTGDLPIAEEVVEHTLTVDGDKASVTMITPDLIKNDQELIEKAGLDVEKWRLSGKMKIKAWGQGQKGAADNPVVIQLWSVSADFELRENAALADDAIQEKLLEKVRNASPVYDVAIARPKTGNLVRLHTPDLHLGKDGFQFDWTMKAAEDRILTVINEFAHHADTYGADRISWPLGHDLLHIDKEHVSRSGTLHTTSSGTPVERTIPWVNLFLLSCDLSSRIVRRLLQIAPLDINVVPGNHDRQSSIAIGKVVAAEFHNTEAVQVNIDALHDKYYEWGKCGFMDTHGDTSSFNDLPLNFSLSNRELWGQCPFLEVNTGHKHISKKMPVGVRTNEKGCMVYISPSLSPQDYWHRKYHYHGMPGAEAFFYHEEKGPFANFHRFF